MLVIEKNSVYEIDEECLKKRRVPEECGVYQKLVRKQKSAEKRGSNRMHALRTFQYHE